MPELNFSCEKQLELKYCLKWGWVSTVGQQ